MNTVYRITLDIHKVGSQAVIPVFQGDSGYTIIANFVENGRPYTMDEGCTAFFQAKKPDGNLLYNACVINNNAIVYDFLTTVKDGETCQTTAAVGSLNCQFKLLGANGGILASPYFNIVVYENTYNEQDIVNSSSEYTALTELVADLNAKVNSGYFKGEKGDPGEPGLQGERGESGYTPQKGTDYCTEADKQEMVDLVIAALPNGDEVSY